MITEDESNDVSNGPASPPAAGNGGRRLTTRGGTLLATLIIPALLALVLLRVAIPSRLEGARGGALGWLAAVADEQSLIVFVVLFLVLSEVTRYWYRLGRVDRKVAPAGPRRVAKFVAVVVILAAVAFGVRSSVAGVVRVVGPSMVPTLEIGDRVLVNRLAYGFTTPLGKTTPRSSTPPQRGDLVVFNATLPGEAKPQRLVKRVIGVPGDTVDAPQGTLRINGWSIPFCDAGPYVVMTGRLTVRGRLGVEFLGDKGYLIVKKPVEENFGSSTIKPGQVFVVGDDRGLSSDSRLWADSTGSGIPVEAIEGRVARVLVGSLPDGRVDLSRLLSRPLSPEVRQPNLDLTETKKRIAWCIAHRPAETSPPAPATAPMSAPL